MIFRNWLTIENLDYTDFLEGKLELYQTHNQTIKLAHPFIYHLIQSDFYSQTTEFELAERELSYAQSLVNTPQEKAEYLLSKLFLLNRKGDLHEITKVLVNQSETLKSYHIPEFQMYVQLLTSISYFRNGDLKKAMRLMREKVDKETSNLWLKMWFCTTFSEYLIYTGNLLEAQKIFQKVEQILAFQKSAYYTFLPVFYRYQALLARSQFDVPKAKFHLNNALEINLSLYGKQHADTAFIFCEQAILALQEGNYESMNRFNGYSEKIRTTLYIDNQAEIAQNIALRAIYAGMRGNAEKGIQLYQDAYQKLEKATSTENPNLYGLKFSESVFQAEKGEPKKSLEVMAECLQKTRKVRGKNFVELAPANTFLAESYLVLGNNFEARKHLLEAFRICGETVGEENVVYADCLKTLGGIYKSEDQNPKAERTLIESLNLLITLNQKNTPRFVGVLRDLANLYQHVGETKKSIQYLQRCIQTVEQFEYPSPAQLLGLYLQLCDIYAETTPEKANPYFEKVAKIGKNLPHDHPIHISILKTAASVKIQLKKYKDALKYSEMIVQLLTLQEDFHNPIFEEIELQICDLLLKTKQFKRCVQRAKIVLNQRDSPIFEYYLIIKLLEALRKSGQLEEAEKRCRIYLNSNAQLPDLSDYFLEMALIYLAQKKHILAKRYFQEAIMNLNRVAGVNSYRHLRVLETYKKLARILKDRRLENAIAHKIIEIKAIHLN